MTDCLPNHGQVTCLAVGAGTCQGEWDGHSCLNNIHLRLILAALTPCYCLMTYLMHFCACRRSARSISSRWPVRRQGIHAWTSQIRVTTEFEVILRDVLRSTEVMRVQAPELAVLLPGSQPGFWGG